MDNKRRSAPVSLIQIAQEAQVSPATVSRAFNRPALVQASTLERIMAIAERHGFRPNRLGSSLRSGSTRTLGLVLPTLSNPVFADCFEGAEMRARASGYSVMMTVAHYDPEQEADAVQRLIDHQLDGIILTVANPQQSTVLKTLKARDVRYVLAYNESNAHPCSAVDNHAAASDMIEHLAQLGHRRIAFISGPLSMSDRAAARLSGARNQARTLGLSLVRHHLMPSHTQADTAVLQQILGTKSPPTALFCSNDLLATAVIVSLRELGYDVPQDISVAGFDGIRYGAVMSPSLTTIEAAGYEIGKTACHLLLEQIEHQPLRSQQVPHTLITGASAAPLLTMRRQPVTSKRI